MERWHSAAIQIFNISCFVAGEGDERASVRGAMVIINVILTDRKQAQYMKKVEKKNVTSRLLLWFLEKINNLDPTFI